MVGRNRLSALEAQTTQVARRVFPNLPEWLYSVRDTEPDFLRLCLEGARGTQASHQAPTYFSDQYINFFIHHCKCIYQLPARAILNPIFGYIALRPCGFETPNAFSKWPHLKAYLC